MVKDRPRPFDALTDDELMARYRRSMPPGEGVSASPDSALEAEMRRRRILPDREKTIPEDPPHELSGPNGPVEPIPTGPESADADNGSGGLPGQSN